MEQSANISVLKDTDVFQIPQAHPHAHQTAMESNAATMDVEDYVVPAKLVKPVVQMELVCPLCPPAFQTAWEVNADQMDAEDHVEVVLLVLPVTHNKEDV